MRVNETGVVGAVAEALRSRLRAASLAVLGVVVCCAVPPTAALASSAPEIGAESVSVSGNSATLEAPIRPGALETKYEFWLEYPVCQLPSGGVLCDAIVVQPIGAGRFAASVEEGVAGVRLSGLQWGYSYTVWVIADNADGTREGSPQTFTIPAAPPPGDTGGSGGGAPVEFKAESWNTEGAERVGGEAPRLEAEREAQRKEAEERPVEEAAQRAAKEREVREAAERAGRAAATRELPPRPQDAPCLVPALKGDSLAVARAVLRQQHCELGAVARPRRHGGALVVTAQSRPRGTKLPHGAGVALRLGGRPR
jgi:hypothetical protein